MRSREEIAEIIYNNLLQHKEILSKQYIETSNGISYFFLDNLLPPKFTKKLYTVFPSIDKTIKKKNLREYKHIAYQMNEYDSLLEETLYAFQDEKIVNLIADICNLKNVYADENLYAGGLSLMSKGNYLNPHLDNSHDKDRNRWRVLNLLFYVTPNWQLENGGNLELWNNGVKGQPHTIVSKFNRLVVMVTHQNSWHSVNKVTTNTTRCCISNYYFSNEPILASDTFHVTSFKGRPEEKFKSILLSLDSKIRGSIRGVFKKGVRENPHQYKNGAKFKEEMN